MLKIFSFAPFAGRSVNGSTTVAVELTQRLRANDHEVEHIVLPTEWNILPALPEIFDGADAIVGLGEGFDHYVSVERFAFRHASGKDNAGETAPSVESWPNDLEVLESNMRWIERWIDLEVLEATRLPAGVIRGTFDGYYLCNALHYHALAWKLQATHARKAGFIHLPPQQEWQRRNQASEQDYAATFARVVQAVIAANHLTK